MDVQQSRDDLETAWAAGLYEGEGCATLTAGTGTYRQYPQVSLSMTDRDVVERFARWAGVGSVRPRKPNPPYKQMWGWFVGDQKGAVDVLLRLMPHLGERRFEQASRVVNHTMENMARRPPLQPCGTDAAYQRHRLHGEQPCRPCLDAAAAYRRDRRKQTA